MHESNAHFQSQILTYYRCTNLRKESLLHITCLSSSNKQIDLQILTKTSGDVRTRTATRIGFSLIRSAKVQTFTIKKNPKCFHKRSGSSLIP